MVDIVTAAAPVVAPFVAPIVIGAALYVAQEPIRYLVVRGYKAVYNFLYVKLIVNGEQNPKIILALKNEIALLKNINKKEVSDYGGKLYFDITDGRYEIPYKRKTIYIQIKKDKVKIQRFWSYVNVLEEFVDEIYRKHINADNVLILHNSNEDKWSFPIIRRPRLINNMKITNDMKKVIEDVDNFMKPDTESKYNSQSIPYRMGYLLEGGPGTGKTTLTEIIAIKYNMDIYMINMNGSKMNDEVLINLISRVPAQSLIVIEELEKQLETLKLNTNNRISEGGILSAIDGPQRLPHRSIIVVTVNKLNKLDDDFKNPLMRRGRLDKHYILNEKL